MITLELTPDDGAFLAEQLKSQRRHIENELVHTDKRQMQAELARDLERINRLCDRVTLAMTTGHTA